MAALSFAVGIIGNIISILVFISPIKTFWWVAKNGTTDRYKGEPYITTLLSTSLWSFYGILKPGGLLIVTVNAVGAVMQLIYVSLFLIYSPKDRKVRLMKLSGLLNVGFLGTVVAVTLLAMHGSMRLTFVGILCAGLTICMYAAPMSVMKTVIQTKSVKYMPFLLSFFLFLNGSIWSTYAVLVKDLYIAVPNGVGFVLGSAQVILYVIYKNKTPSSSANEEGESKDVEGSAHLVKGSDIEMGLHKDGEDNDGPRSRTTIIKGNSLPKPSLNRQNSVKKIMKTLSLSPYELSYIMSLDEEGENGRK
ncbi:hypothetical protein MLD38_016466 [Melastoma candidum]|uniref:Uncharacterized protein n=1 Tax=Melastoma candidum TaxID=119954 RepID=A0ACB9QLU8_9MYRT|nr:hypothetical protein MLD38_016466 [Melastoma candidum]